jgi:hypothetical protein
VGSLERCNRRANTGVAGLPTLLCWVGERPGACAERFAFGTDDALCGTIMNKQARLSPSSIDAMMRADHETLEQSIRTALAQLAGSPMDTVRASWLQMESRLVAHLDAEEHYMLPRFAKAYPHEAAQIYLMHKQLRATLEQLGLDLDLHTLRVEAAESFVRMLHEHAAFEERLFYEWSHAALPVAEHRSILRRLRPTQHTEYC